MRTLVALAGVIMVAAQPPLLAAAEEEAGGRRPLVVQVRLANQPISPVTARFLERAILQAQEEDADCVVLILDTPGGLVTSTRDMVKTMLRSQVPIVVYVAPSGARAASAGVFITLAGHVAAMAPGTNIGAAHPVQVGGLPGSPPPKSDKEDKAPIEEKILNDTVAWARSLAELRGRNAAWAARAVKESLSVSALEAVKENAVDFVAEDVRDLLDKIDGREVNLPGGSVKLRTAAAQIREIEMWWGEELLGVLANPNVAFLLLLLGFYGILFELYSPGWGIAGTLGVICLVLGFFALAVLPINYVGLALIALALALFVAEAFVVSYGFLTIGGVICLVLGGLMLIESPAGFQRVSLWVVIPVALATAAITVFLVDRIIKSQRRKARTGGEALVGNMAETVEAFVPDGDGYTGMVRAHGELWKAYCSKPLASGQAVRIQERQGLTLLILPQDATQEAMATGT